MEFEKMIDGLVDMVKEGRDGSNVTTRRNWVIRTEVWDGKPIILWAGRYGEAARRGLLSESVSLIVKDRIRWYTFTRKADFEQAMQILQAVGFREW